MNIYNSDHPAPVLNNNELQALQIRPEKYQGFLSFADINSMIARRAGRSPEAGVRVYRAEQPQLQSSTSINMSNTILATPVLPNGFEDGFVIHSPDLSRRIQGPNSTLIQDQRSRDTLKENATFIVDTATPVTAFFSSSMLEKIDQDNPNAIGLSFFLVDLANVADQHLTHPLQQGNAATLASEKGRLQTFLAVATHLDTNGEVAIPTSVSDPNSIMLSNMPSPGYGLSVKVEFELAVDPSPDWSLFTHQPYIVPWDKD